MFITSLKAVDALPSPPLGLLPAVHDAEVEVISGTFTPPAPGTATGQVFQNGTGTIIDLPELAGWPAARIKPGAFFACDGRCFYEVVRHAGGPSFYPAHFERTLFTVHVTPQILPLGGTLRLERFFSFRLFNNITNAVWRVIWEIGVRTSVAAVGPNLEGFNWLQPAVDQEIVLTDVESRHGLGLVIQNTSNGYQGVQLLYDRTLGAPEGSMPTAADFALRCRLGLFDTEDSVADPRGYAGYTASDIKKQEEE
jgi:hypothetical protein